MTRAAFGLACGLICLGLLAVAVQAVETTAGNRRIAPASAESSFDPPTICRTAIAAIVDRDPKLMQTRTAPDGVVMLTYARPIDNFVWAYRCRLEGNRVVWANEPGRWRDGAKDDKIFFEVVGAGAQLRIIDNHANGTTTRELFDRAKIE
jgi:hypothetical protein